MTDLDKHADALVEFHKRLIAGGVDDQAAGFALIDLNKSILTGATTLGEASKADSRATLEAAATAKAMQRAERLGLT